MERDLRSTQGQGVERAGAGPGEEGARGTADSHLRCAAAKESPCGAQSWKRLVLGNRFPLRHAGLPQRPSAASRVLRSSVPGILRGGPAHCWGSLAEMHSLHPYLQAPLPPSRLRAPVARPAPQSSSRPPGLWPPSGMFLPKPSF